MGIVERLLGRNKEAQVVRDVALETAKRDALKVVAILKGSLYTATMPWNELVVRFGRTEGCNMSEASKRLVSAMGVLTKSQAIGWGGVGSDVSFSRTIPIVVM